MKKILTLIAVLVCVQFAQSQSVKKYLTLHHFTNTRCGICGSQNPAFFDKIGNYENDIHHISIHPPVPYDNCELYLDNPTQNATIASFYSIFGTPRVAFNGLSPSSVSGVTTDDIEEAITATSDIAIAVEESTDLNRTVNVSVHTFGEHPTGNLKIFVAIVEKEVFYDAPNGETVHHNVFREMISNVNGDAFVAAETGGSVDLEYTYSINSDWVADEIYVMAWVQDLNTSEILNSGTRFDETISSINVLPEGAVFDIVPNPSDGQFFLTIDQLDLSSNTALIYNTLGQVVREINIISQSQQLDLSALQSGTYILKISSTAGDFTKKIVKL